MAGNYGYSHTNMIGQMDIVWFFMSAIMRALKNAGKVGKWGKCKIGLCKLDSKHTWMNCKQTC